MTGVGIYQGPMNVKHSYFDQYTTRFWNDAWTKILGKRPVSNAGAVSWKKDSTYPVYTSQYTTNLTFGYCDNVSTRISGPDPLADSLVPSDQSLRQASGADQ